METEFTYDELRELCYLVWNRKKQLREQADRYKESDGFAKNNNLNDNDIFEKLAEEAEREFELFKGLESKLEKMRAALWDAQ
ncbi:hypothetical protein [Leptospira interrogans]|uniref:hypothetical protein n=1 Tax=Leptospira interrogans TaxID=173 RepID=UPI001F10B404|nr:hypothetical protein [Leptospira interrogans]UMQ56642.1 hypothetical protein FH585_01625 [Leptospira interrogans]UNE66429.1 hypothetical protein FH588_18070 [Leptospira interrogans]UNE69195.1 hypothetical protein FH588_23230 [Leptospira interrogans]UNE69258.1 hypothetical protein FH588_23115 [Leptospira interrogans]